MCIRTRGRFVPLFLALGILVQGASGVTHKKKKTHPATTASKSAVKPKIAATAKVVSTAPATHHYVRRKSTARVVAVSYVTSPLAGARIAGGPWTARTFADSTFGDNVDGEDLTIRRAAVDALGKYNGTVVAVDPGTGRILTTVNQKLAQDSGFQPCSTIKVAVSLAALGESIISPTTVLRVGGARMTLIDALAHSNNFFFATLGLKLGYERFSYYAHLFGLGEKAGWNIPGEKAGAFPSAPPVNGGMGMLTSFGEGISLTPYELAALLSAIANGGTMYYLQYPRTQAEIEHFSPRVKRQLEITRWLPGLKAGMQAAVQRGTARRAAYNQPEALLGKTGTCTSNGTHLGWFGSFNDDSQKVVVVVLLTGGAGVSGPAASQIAGNFYRNLSNESYFAKTTPAALIPTQMCCTGQ